MLTIRLTRKGKTNQPFFRIVVIDKRRSSKGGRPSEILGFVDPLTKKKSFKKDRILYWISVGAQPSDTVHNLLVTEKIIDAPKIKKDKKSKQPVVVAPAPVAQAPAPVEAPAVETPVSAPVAEAPAPAPEAPETPVEEKPV